MGRAGCSRRLLSPRPEAVPAGGAPPPPLATRTLPRLCAGRVRVDHFPPCGQWAGRLVCLVPAARALIGVAQEWAARGAGCKASEVPLLQASLPQLSSPGTGRRESAGLGASCVGSVSEPVTPSPELCSLLACTEPGVFRETAKAGERVVSRTETGARPAEAGGSP